MVAAVASVLVATLPGLVVFAVDPVGVTRVEPSAQATPVHTPLRVPAPTSTAPPETATTAAPAAPPEAEPVEEVPIIPPTEPMTGEVAAASAPVRQPFASTRAGSGEVMALIVGIDDYPGSRYDLSAAVADADAIDAALARFGVPKGNRVVLRNGQARRQDMVDALQALVQRAERDTIVVFAFAGHVQKLAPGTEAIITADGQHLVDTELATILAPARAERMWLLLASCYAGGFTEVLAPGRVLTGASDANSLAYESPTLGASYLVHHMVRKGWLEGHAGDSVQEAFAYADSAIASRYPHRRPVQIDRGSGPLRLGALPATTPTTAKPYQPPVPSQQPEKPSPSAPTTAPTVPPTSPTTTPERRCTLIVLCSKS